MHWGTGILLGVLLAVAGGTAAADEFYVFVDATGVAHFTNIPKDSRYRPFPLVGLKAMTSHLPASSYQTLIQAASAQHNLDPLLVHALIQAESSFNPRAVSEKGAQGLMQIMPQTAGRLAVSNPFDPEENVNAGARHLRRLLDAFRGNLPLALAAYNAGEKTVRQYGGIPPYPETRAYVSRVLTLYDRRGTQPSPFFLRPRPEAKTQLMTVRESEGGPVYSNIPPLVDSSRSSAR